MGGYRNKKVSIEEALYNFTKDGAYASFEEDIKGSIEEGMLADMIVLDQNVLATPVEEVKDVKVVLTMVDGKIVYEFNK